MVDSDDYSEYDADGNIERGIEKNGFVQKSHAKFIDVTEERVNSIRWGKKGDPNHHPDVTGLRPQANVVGTPQSKSLQYHKEVWARGVKHMNENIFGGEYVKAKPEANIETLDGKPLTVRAKIEGKGAILYLDKDK